MAIRFVLCERQGCGQPAIRVKAMTAYHWDGTGEDPNRDRWFCLEDKRDYEDYWREMWAEYYANLR